MLLVSREITDYRKGKTTSCVKPLQSSTLSGSGDKYTTGRDVFDQGRVLWLSHISNRSHTIEMFLANDQSPINQMSLLPLLCLTSYL